MSVVTNSAGAIAQTLRVATLALVVAFLDQLLDDEGVGEVASFHTCGVVELVVATSEAVFGPWAPTRSLPVHLGTLLVTRGPLLWKTSESSGSSSGDTYYGYQTKAPKIHSQKRPQCYMEFADSFKPPTLSFTFNVATPSIIFNYRK